MQDQDLEPNSIPQVGVRCPNDEFENMIRKLGVGYCCEWFGHEYNSEFSQETARILKERSNEQDFTKSN